MKQAQELYTRLLQAYGTPRWWSEDPYQVMIQSVLVQNTAWTSVEKTSAAMGSRLKPAEIAGMPIEALRELIRPCGFAKAKSEAIRRLTDWYAGYGYSREKVCVEDTEKLRTELLSLKGVGAETADAILVYAFHKPSFIIDAYTRRFLARLGFSFSDDRAIRTFFEDGLPRDFRIYGWFHWLILDHGITHCRKTPQCEGYTFLGNGCGGGNIA